MTVAGEFRPPVDLADCRAEVQAFAILMERKLRANDHKSHWSGCTLTYLLQRLDDEVAELRAAKYSRARRAEECVDVANFAMMIADTAVALGKR